jgi:hypothetical protein
MNDRIRTLLNQMIAIEDEMHTESPGGVVFAGW